MDLNIDNYGFNDILNLFALQYHFNESDLKNAKKTVLKTHPDKSGLDKDYFLFFTKAYKLLYKVFVFRSKVHISQRDDKDYDAEDVEEFERENEELINRVKDSKDFNKVFNELFVNMNLIDEDTGYGEWLKNDSGVELPKCNTPGDMQQVLNSHKNSVSSTLIKHDIQDFYATNTQQQTLDSVESYGSSIFSKLQFEDLKTAHEDGIIPVLDSGTIEHKSYETIVDERSYVVEPRDRQTADAMITRQMLADENAANKRAFKLAKKTAVNEEKTTQWWGKFKQIMDT